MVLIALRKTTLPLFLGILAMSSPVRCDELSLMSSGGFAAPLAELIPQFEQTTHNKVVVITMSMGLGQDSIVNRVRRQQPADVVFCQTKTSRSLSMKVSSCRIHA